MVSIFGTADIDESRAFAVFIPASLITVIIAFIADWISDHIYLKKLLYILMGFSFQHFYSYRLAFILALSMLAVLFILA